MIVNIQIDTNEPLSTKDLDLLHLFTGLDKSPIDFPTDVERAAAEKPAPAKKTAAKKTAPAKKAAEPEPEDSTDFEALRATALEKASNLLANGQRDFVMSTLSSVDAAKVSQIDDDRLQEFIDALEVA